MKTIHLVLIALLLFGIPFFVDEAQRQRLICKGSRIVIREMARDHLFAILGDVIALILQVALHSYEFTATAPGQ